MPEIKKQKQNVTSSVVSFTSQEVEAILTNAALAVVAQEEAGRKKFIEFKVGPQVSTELKIRQLTEGSPAYDISKWSAVVKVTEDHEYVAVAEKIA